ncbi:MAG: hypothetical protein PVF27_10070 [Gemmatimonadales bacterium]
MAERLTSTAMVHLAALASLFTLIPARAAAQYPDAYLVPRGALRVSIEPSYRSWRERYDAEGNIEPLGTDLSDSAAGVRLIPTLLDPERAVGRLIGEPAYEMNAGVWTVDRDADIRRVPFNVAFGFTDWLTVTASLPLVTTRSQVSFSVDSGSANVGWNQVATQAANAAATGQIQTLLADLEAAAAYVEAEIAAGSYGCPTSTTCDQARAAVDRTRAVADDLAALLGIDASGTVAAQLPPFAPLAGSAAGLALADAVSDLSAELAGFGAPTVGGALPLPSGAVTADDANAVLTDPAFGYNLFPLEFNKYRNLLGDLEIGLRVGLLQEGPLRAVAQTTVRLPTGTHEDPDHLLDLGTGDRQTDVEFGLEAAWEPVASLALAASARYTLQLSDRLPRRVTSHDRPIVPAVLEAVVERNLGDEVRLGVYPSLRLNESFRAYFSARYFRKGSDRFTVPNGLPSVTPAPTDDALEFETAMRSVSLGGGVHYRSVAGRRGPTLPIEAGIDYRAAFRGSGGQTPMDASVTVYLRLYYRLFGEVETAQEPQPGNGESGNGNR